jgi:hypothetical protein
MGQVICREVTSSTCLVSSRKLYDGFSRIAGVSHGVKVGCDAGYRVLCRNLYGAPVLSVEDASWAQLVASASQAESYLA